MTSGVQHFLNFIEVGHGKGENDDARECVKRALSREELKYEGGTILENIETIVQWYSSMMGSGNTGKFMVSNFFWLICENDIEYLKNLCTVKGSSEMHSCRSSKEVPLAIFRLHGLLRSIISDRDDKFVNYS